MLPSCYDSSLRFIRESKRNNSVLGVAPGRPNVRELLSMRLHLYNRYHLPQAQGATGSIKGP